LGMTLLFAEEFVSMGESWELCAAVMSVYLLIYTLWIWFKFGYRFLSPGFLFFMASYLLHLALVILIGFHIKEFDGLSNVALYSYSERDCAMASFYCCWFLFVYASSYLLFHSRKPYDKKRIIDCGLSEESAAELKKAGTAGRILLILSAPAMFYNNFLMIYTRFTQAYSKIYSIDTTFYKIPLGPLINLFLPAVFFILYSHTKNKKKFIITGICISFYSITYMILSGAKIAALITIIVILIMYNHYFGLKLSLKLILSGYIAAKVIVAVTSMRSDIGLMETGVWGQFINGFLNKDPVIDLLVELGGTILTPTLVFLAIRSGGNYLYGLSYLYGPIGSILKGLRISDYFSDKADLHAYLTDPARGAYINGKTYAMGGSAIGEWYLNFGWIGLLFIPVFVWLIIKLEKVLFDDKESAYRKVMAYCFAALFIMYARQYITDLFWITFYRCISCYILLRFLSKKSAAESDFHPQAVK
jgi:oligosaccharide repeat unit polymerase